MIRRWLKLRAKIRYWKRRALKAESGLRDALDSLDAEVIRNRYREDTFASAAVLGHRGMYGLPPREGPALQRPRQQLTVATTATAATAPLFSGSWDTGFTWADKEEFKLEWLPAVNAGTVSLPQAQQDFAAEIARRRIPLNDDPFSH